MKKYFPRLALSQSGILIILSIVLGLIVNGVHPRRVTISFHRPVMMAADDSVFSRILHEDDQGGKGGNDQSGIQFIHTRQLTSLLQKKMAVVLDARNEAEFKTAHIPQAIHLPFENFFAYMEVVESLPRDRWLVTYCDGPPCDLSHLLAQELINAGFKWVAIYDEGLNGWRRARLMVKSEGGAHAK